jgi:hypothetical protein
MGSDSFRKCLSAYWYVDREGAEKKNEIQSFTFNRNFSALDGNPNTMAS